MSGYVFTDESKRRDFVLVAGVVLPGSLVDARQQIKNLHLPGQRGLHMVKESTGRQIKILQTVAALQPTVTVYLASKGTYKTEHQARQRCLQALIADIASQGHSHLCIERDDSSVVEDRRLIRQQLGLLNYRDQLRYTHEKATSEPLLAIPDAIAWAWPQRGIWQQRCSPVIDRVFQV